MKSNFLPVSKKNGEVYEHYLFNSIDIENPSSEHYFEHHVPGLPLFLSLASGYQRREVAAYRRKIDLICQRMTCGFACNSIKSSFIHKLSILV